MWWYQDTERTKSKASQYTGDWDNNEFHGKGSYYWPAKGQTFTGSLQFFLTNVTEGQYHRNLRHGKGEIKFQDGAKYHGTWNQGNTERAAIVRTPEGKQCVGEWVGDEFIVKKPLKTGHTAKK